MAPDREEDLLWLRFFLERGTLVGLEPDCKHFVEPLKTGVLCKFYGEKVGGCHECNKCPKCGGRTQTERHVLDIQGHTVERLEIRACVYCSKRTKGVVKVEQLEVPVTQKVEPEGHPPKCEVVGCPNRAWEGYMYLDRLVCAVHKDRVYNHKLRKQDIGRRPLLIEDGELVDNPFYFSYYRGK